jgi:hypothetical protein
MTKIAAINKAAIYSCSQWLVYLMIRTSDCLRLHLRRLHLSPSCWDNHQINEKEVEGEEL